MVQDYNGIRKRIPIRRRFLTTVLLTTVICILAVSITGFFCIRWIHHSTEQTLTEQLELNLKGIIQEKVNGVDDKLNHYEKYVEFITDSISNIYADEQQMVSIGFVPGPPTDTKDYAMTRGFSSADIKASDLEGEMRMFSNLRYAWMSIAKENKDLITTMYLGTEDGLLLSYDRYSYLSVPPKGQELVYDYFVSEWYKKAMAEDGVVYTDVYMDSQGRGLTMTVCSAFKNAKGEKTGVASMDFDLSELYNDLFSTNLHNGTFIFALDQKNNIISPDSDTIDLQEYTGLTMDELDDLRADPDGVMDCNGSTYVCIPMESLGWTLCASVPKESIAQSVHDSEDTIRNAILVFACVVLLILVLAVIAANRSVTAITHPLELLEKDIKIISNGDLSYRASVYRNDEIGDITSGMNEMVDRLNFTMNELASSQQHADEMSRLANLDTLTGIRNKTAFDRLQKALNEKLNNGEVDFGFAMVDLNNLKVINDNYGHDKGDATIRGLCEIIADTFANSNAYRVGGDEFVVVLMDEDYHNVKELVERFKWHIRTVSGDKNLKPWERVSAAIGYALYNAHVDSGTESVLSRADREMYACKKEMKSGRA